MERILATPGWLRRGLILAGVTATVLVTACGGGGDGTTPTENNTPKPVASVAVSLASSSVVTGQATTATAELRDANGVVLSGRPVAWSSSNVAVATVAADGAVSALTAGTTSITATSEGRSGSATLTVTAIPVASVSLSQSTMDIPIRASATAVATARDGAGQPLAGRTITWQSSNTIIATVSPVGEVRMLLPGSATITASCEGRSASMQVNGTLVSLSTLVDSMRLARGLPAMGAIVVTREGVAAVGVAGTRRITGAVPVTVNDQWHIGSDLKAITAMLAGIAVQDGVLAWSRTAEQAFPDLVPTMRAEYKPITLLEVLSHQSGMINTVTGLANGATNLPFIRTEWIKYSFQQPPNNARGVYYYSNNGYGVAGSMIERAWGGTYENLLLTRLFQPLGITSASFGWGPTTTVGGMDQPVGHMLQGGTWVPCEGCDNPPASSPMGRAHMSMDAWARIVQELMLADQGRSTLLTQATARTLTTVAVPPGATTPYAMGWIVTNATPGSRIITHDGSNNANHSRATVALDAGVAFLINTNAADLAGGVTGNALTAMNTRLNQFWINGR